MIKIRTEFIDGLFSSEYFDYIKADLTKITFIKGNDIVLERVIQNPLTISKEMRKIACCSHDLIHINKNNFESYIIIMKDLITVETKGMMQVEVHFKTLFENDKSPKFVEQYPNLDSSRERIDELYDLLNLYKEK